jgi:hypothetical protein
MDDILHLALLYAFIENAVIICLIRKTDFRGQIQKEGEVLCLPVLVSKAIH